ncbi:hypothetical protein JST97_01345 [bacterium]|nr:hypothetical protein [bacterium]
MEITHLPSAWASYLNELAFFRTPAENTRAAFAEALQDARNWHYFESSYWVSEAQKQALANLEYVLGQMEACHDLQKLLPWAFEAVQLMEGVQAERDKATYSPDPLINDLVLCGACSLQGQALPRALSERLPRLQAWGERLAQAFEAMRPMLPEEAQRDLEVGFRNLDQVLTEFTSLDTLKTGMGRLVDCSELLLVLVEWRKKAREQQLQRFRRWSALPMVGAGLEQAFEQLERLNPAQRANFWLEVVRPLWIEISNWWGQQRELLPLPCEFLCEWLGQVDQDLAELTDFEPGPAIADPTLAELTDWVEDLAASFGEAAQQMGTVAHLRGGAAGHYFEVIQGLLRNTLPVPAVPALFEQSNPPEAWGGVVERLLEYSKGGPRELLYEARDQLLRLVPPPDLSDHGGWTCPFCQQTVAAGRTSCGHCGGGASLSLDVQSWNA